MGRHAALALVVLAVGCGDATGDDGMTLVYRGSQDSDAGVVLDSSADADAGLVEISAADLITDEISDVADAAAPDVAADPGPEIVADVSVDAPPDSVVDGEVSVDVPPDAATPQDAAADPGAPPDVGPDALGPDDLGPDDLGPPPDCPAPPDFDYACTADAPATCPDGICLFGLCLGPVFDVDLYAGCGDGVCGPCEMGGGCPADCSAPPSTTGVKDHDNETTLTVWVHGFSNKSASDLASTVYGSQKGCGGLLGDLASWGIARPCAQTPEGALAPNHFSAIEYYGALAPDWMSPEDVAEVESHPVSPGLEGLQRYALVVAKTIRHQLDLSGATHVNLACHSMGCLVLRHVIENDVESLASESRFVRWFTSAGVLAGARLARLFDNPTVQAGAEALGLQVFDFAFMLPDYVQAVTASWDHRLWEGNNPLLRDTLIHHMGGTDPAVKAALGIQLLNIDNPTSDPNDGIQYTDDEFFHAQAEDAALHLPGGGWRAADHTFVFDYHEYVPDHAGTVMVAAATLFHRRRAVITLAELELLDDRESDTLFDGEHGAPPAEIGLEVEVHYAPYATEVAGIDPLVHETRVAHNSVDVFTQAEGTTSHPDAIVFAAPVFDDMAALRLDVKMLEIDWYPHEGISEWAFDAHQSLLDFHGQVPLEAGTFEVASAHARAVFAVEVLEQY